MASSFIPAFGTGLGKVDAEVFFKHGGVILFHQAADEGWVGKEVGVAAVIIAGAWHEEDPPAMSTHGGAPALALWEEKDRKGFTLQGAKGQRRKEEGTGIPKYKHDGQDESTGWDCQSQNVLQIVSRSLILMPVA